MGYELWSREWNEVISFFQFLRIFILGANICIKGCKILSFLRKRFRQFRINKLHLFIKRSWELVKKWGFMHFYLVVLFFILCFHRQSWKYLIFPELRILLFFANYFFLLLFAALFFSLKCGNLIFSLWIFCKKKHLKKKQIDIIAVENEQGCKFLDVALENRSLAFPYLRLPNTKLSIFLKLKTLLFFFFLIWWPVHGILRIRVVSETALGSTQKNSTALSCTF